MTELQQLRAFDVRFEYGLRRTVWLVRAHGAPRAAGPSGPVAKVAKEADPESRRPYRVFEGPALDRPVGTVSQAVALDAEGFEIGRIHVESERRLLADDQIWTFTQAGLDPLHGTPRGLASRARHNAVVGEALENGLTDLLSAHRMRFRAPGSEGFELTRRAGVHSRYRVAVHDDQVNRLLVLACIARFDSEYGTTDVRKLLPSVVGLFRR